MRIRVDQSTIAYVITHCTSKNGRKGVFPKHLEVEFSTIWCKCPVCRVTGKVPYGKMTSAIMPLIKHCLRK